VENPENYFFSTGRHRTRSDSEGVKHRQTTRGFERILKIEQYLTKLCVDYSGPLVAYFFGPPCIFTLDVIYTTPLSCMPEFLISAITCNRASVASEKIFEKMREEEHNGNIGTKSGGRHLYRRFLLTEM